MSKDIRGNQRGFVRVTVRSQASLADRVCTFQVHSRRRIGGTLRPIRSKSITAENASLTDGLKIIHLGIEAFNAAVE